MKGDRLYLIHIGECIARVEQYTAGGRDEFLASTLIQDAVLRNLQTLAESTQRLSDAVKKKHSGVDWRGLAGFRNVLVHDYLGVDAPRVWLVIESDLPAFKAKLKPLLRRAKKSATRRPKRTAPTGKTPRKAKPAGRRKRSDKMKK